MEGSPAGRGPKARQGHPRLWGGQPGIWGDTPVFGGTPQALRGQPSFGGPRHRGSIWSFLTAQPQSGGCSGGLPNPQVLQPLFLVPKPKPEV